jgi:hypothetical protein
VVVCLFASRAPGRRPTPAQNWHKTALDPEVLERTVAQDPISEIEESNKPVLPIEMPCLAGLDGTQDRVIFFLNVCFSSLPESLRLDLGFYTGMCLLSIIARPGRLQRKKSEMPAQCRHSDIRTTQAWLRGLRQAQLNELGGENLS